MTNNVGPDQKPRSSVCEYLRFHGVNLLEDKLGPPETRRIFYYQFFPTGEGCALKSIVFPRSKSISVTVIILQFTTFRLFLFVCCCCFCFFFCCCFFFIFYFIFYLALIWSNMIQCQPCGLYLNSFRRQMVIVTSPVFKSNMQHPYLAPVSWFFLNKYVKNTGYVVT